MKPHIAILTIALLAAGCDRDQPAAKALRSFAEHSKTPHDRFLLADLFGKGLNGPRWDRLFIFAPHTSNASIEGSLGFTWADVARIDLAHRSDIHLAVWCDGMAVSHFEEWPVSNFDVDSSLVGIPLGAHPFDFVAFDNSRTPPTLTPPPP